MPSDAELVSRHVQSLKEAREHCAQLGRCQDPAIIMPRGWRYAALKKAVSELEGTCRQMAHMRSDARWLRLGVIYAKLLRTIQSRFVGHDWAAFAKLTALFDKGLYNMEELKNGRTGHKQGAILPENPSSWIILPDHVIPQPRWLPTGNA